MNITRVTSEGGDPGDTFGEEDRIWGKCNNIILPAVSHPHIDGFGPIGTEPYWNETVELTQFTFDLLDASEAPESLGPVDLYFDIVTPLSNGFQKKHRIGGKIQQGPTGTYDRAAEYPRNLIVVPFLFVVGGSQNSLQANQTDIDEPSADDNTGPFSYADIREGKYLTRVVGGKTIQHLPRLVSS